MTLLEINFSENASPGRETVAADADLPQLSALEIYAGLSKSKWFEKRKPAERALFANLIRTQIGPGMTMVPPEHYRHVVSSAVGYVMGDKAGSFGAREDSQSPEDTANAIVCEMIDQSQKMNIEGLSKNVGPFTSITP